MDKYDHYHIPYIPEDLKPEKWDYYRFDILDKIRNGQIAPIEILSVDDSPIKENECCICYSIAKQFPLNRFDLCCNGTQYICTLCLLSHPHFDYETCSIKCSCNKVIYNSYHIFQDLPQVPQNLPQPKQQISEIKTTSKQNNNKYNKNQAKKQCKQTRKQQKRQPDFDDDVPQTQQARQPTMKMKRFPSYQHPKNLPLPQLTTNQQVQSQQSNSYRPYQHQIDMNYINENHFLSSSSSSSENDSDNDDYVHINENYDFIQNVFNPQPNNEDRERIEFERNIRQDVLQILKQFNVEIPLYVPADYFNTIDVDLLIDREMAEAIVQSIVSRFLSE